MKARKKNPIPYTIRSIRDEKEEQTPVLKNATKNRNKDGNAPISEEETILLAAIIAYHCKISNAHVILADKLIGSVQ